MSKQTKLPYGSTSLQILLLEDDLVFAFTLQSYLSKQGFDFVHLPDGIAGLRFLQQGGNPDLILLDLGMPKLNGLGFMQRIQQLSLNPPIIVITASHELKSANKALRMGAWDYLLKPVGDLELVNQTILECIRATRNNPDSASNAWYQSQQNLQLLKNKEAMLKAPDVAYQIQQQLWPESDEVAEFRYCVQHYGLISRYFCDVFNYQNKNICGYVVHVQEDESNPVFIQLLLRSWFDQSRYQTVVKSSDDTVLLDPKQQLAGIQNLLFGAGIQNPLEIGYWCLNRESGEFKLAVADSKLQLYLTSLDTAAPSVPILLHRSAPLESEQDNLIVYHQRCLISGQAIKFQMGCKRQVPIGSFSGSRCSAITEESGLEEGLIAYLHCTTTHKE